MDFSSSLRSVGPNPIISKICDNTDHPPLCLATVLPFAKGEKSITVETVLKFAVEAGSLYAKEALSVTKNLVSKPGTPEDLKATLKDCKNSYDTAVENFAKTTDAFATNDVGTMRSVLSAVITFVGDCEDEFAEMQTQSPLSGYAEKLTDMTSNCLAIVSQMMN
ncbi:pectinesterase inhibitor [Phtheirospermum japonicum]|uniref:Pectinesterase inhibitor n=1 Tax=Phtheirospermum japonicum TaxID=374723 RepID=A0A830BT47_9LAMI|nr:pectinesterase inhibitor [Phtheirospermum japonicum]